MTDFSKGAAFIEGEQVAIADAKIPLMDWGFLHSDATYDVAHTWKGRFFRVDEYIERFEASMAKLRMSIPYDRDQIRLHPRHTGTGFARSAAVPEPLSRLRGALRLDCQ
jgi:branched-chain amino acid aminotransferase